MADLANPIGVAKSTGGLTWAFWCKPCDVLKFRCSEPEALDLMHRHKAYDCRCPYSTVPACHHEHKSPDLPEHPG